jgi:glyoxylase-like metal-dependent hydrolase (beta-lactamase superfamily II)
MMMKRLRSGTTAAALLALLSQSGTAADAPAAVPRAAPPAPARSIAQVKGDVYRANNGGWYVAILDTPEGLLLVDTISAPFSKWLKDELAKKFPGKAVKYVVLSHSHWDHSEGGKIFADSATFIAQEGFLRNMDGRYPALPGDMTDRNNDGHIDVAEFVDPAREHPGYCGMNAVSVTSKDKDGDGRTSPPEFFADTPVPDIVYSDRMTLRFGGKTIQLVFPGKNHANDGTAVLFSDERVLFTVDFPADALVQGSMRSLPSACGNFDGHPMDEWIKSYRTLEALDFDISVGGHGSAQFTKRDLAEGREFMEYLKREVETAMRKGLSLAQMKETIMLEPFKGWAHYERLRKDNIEAAYFNLKTYK